MTASAPSPEPPEWFHFESLKLAYPEWLIEGILPAESMVCIYGKRGQGKTFLALDWACCIATGTTWLGNEIKTKGRVAYVLAERPEGIKRRMLGWLQRHQWDGADGRRLFGGQDGMFFVRQERNMIDDAVERGLLIAALKRLRPLRLVVFDPLIAFMHGLENESRDMQRFVDGVRAIIDAVNEPIPDQRETPNCSVLLVHHEGKGGERNSNRGARGSSALEAAMDAVIHLKGINNSDMAELTITKQREFKAHQPMALRFVGQSDGARDLGQFPELVEPLARATAEPRLPAAKTTGRIIEQKKAAFLAAVEKILERCEPLGVDELHDAMPDDVKQSVSTTRKGLKSLAEAGKLIEMTHKLPNGREALLYSLPITPMKHSKDAAE